MALQTWAVVSHARHDDAGGPVRVESRRPTPPTEEASCIRIRLIFPASPRSTTWSSAYSLAEA